MLRPVERRAAGGPRILSLPSRGQCGWRTLRRETEEGQARESHNFHVSPLGKSTHLRYLRCVSAWAGVCVCVCMRTRVCVHVYRGVATHRTGECVIAPRSSLKLVARCWSEAGASLLTWEVASQVQEAPGLPAPVVPGGEGQYVSFLLLPQVLGELGRGPRRTGREEEGKGLGRTPRGKGRFVPRLRAHGEETQVDEDLGPVT